MNSLEAIDKVFNHLKGGLLSTSITGGVYKHRRPINSVTEDVVINSLGINNEKLQRGVLNVNIHVPNKILRIGGIQTTDQPDHTRLLALTTIAKDELNDIWVDDYGFDVQQDNPIEDEGETFTNIRLEFFNINITN